MIRATVGVLLYGNYPNLAERCLGPLWPLQRSGLIQLRIGCNAIGEDTQNYLTREGAYTDPGVGIISSDRNIQKYPMMRHLIGLGPLAPHFMWFDDDSYIDDPDPVEFLKRSLTVCATSDMVGQVWWIKLGGNQHLWVRDQPWFKGKVVERGHSVKFCQGAWWVIQSRHLEKFDWPVEELERKGGDVMLGELCRQQDLKIYDVGRNFGIRINADLQGNHSKMPTRGGVDPRPIGWDYRPGTAGKVADALKDAPQ